MDRYFKRNVIGISGVEFLWGLGLPIVLESTFLQLFIKLLGASAFQIGLIPAFFFIGSSIFSLLSGYFTSHLKFKRGAVIVLHIVSGVSLFLFGLFLLVFGRVSFILTIFFISYAIFAICVGMTLPVWLNYLVKIFSEERSVSGLSYMLIAQNTARLISSVIIIKIVDTYSFSIKSSAYIFIGVGLLFALGSLFFLFTREAVASPKSGQTTERGSLITHLTTSIRHIKGNRNFLCFLVGDLDYSVIVTVISFYATYATLYRGVAPAVAAGLFIGCVCVGAILSNFFLGTLGWFDLKHKYFVAKLFSITALLLLILAETDWGFFLASFFLGGTRGSRMIMYPPAVKKLSGMKDSTSYFSIAPVVTLPFTAGLPLVFGKFLDHFSYLRADSFRLIFIIAIGLVVVSLFFIHKTDFNIPATPAAREKPQPTSLSPVGK